MRCTAYVNSRTVCDGPLRVSSDWLGRTVWACDRCERRERGLCRDCPRPRVGQSAFCEPCLAAHIKRRQQERDQKYTARRRRRAYARRYWHRVGKHRHAARRKAS